MRKLFYVGLESYSSRYSFQLTEWNTRVFDSMGIAYEVVQPMETSVSMNDGNINVGQVLDAAGRPFFAMAQIQTLLVKISSGEIKDDDVIFFEDMFHPGIESLPYLLDQRPSKKRPKIYVRCLAQTVDPDDFVHSTGISRWMRPFEQMVLKFVDGVFVASHELLAAMTSAGWDAQVAVTGLPFHKGEVQERAGYSEGDDLKTWGRRKNRVVFASRLDQEKQPEFFIELARAVHSGFDQDIEFAFLSGKGLTSNNLEVQRAIQEAILDGTVVGYSNLSKAEYYSILKDSKVLFNCALQDWVSNTVSEADALGCNVLFPAYRSFPEVFKSDHTRLYVPWSIPDAFAKLIPLLVSPHAKMGEISSNQSCSIENTVIAMLDWDNELVVNPSKDSRYRSEYSKNDWKES